MERKNECQREFSDLASASTNAPRERSVSIAFRHEAGSPPRQKLSLHHPRQCNARPRNLRLEWAAGPHFKTEHPQVDVALRKIKADDTPLILLMMPKSGRNSGCQIASYTCWTMSPN